MENLQRWPFDEFGSQKNGDVPVQGLSISVQEVINPRTTGKVRREVAQVNLKFSGGTKHL